VYILTYGNRQHFQHCWPEHHVRPARVTKANALHILSTAIKKRLMHTRLHIQLASWLCTVRINRSKAYLLTTAAVAFTGSGSRILWKRKF